MAPANGRRSIFSPKVDATVRSSKPKLPLPDYPKKIWPIFDPVNRGKACEPWTSEAEKSFYPTETKPCGTAVCPELPSSYSDKYLRAFLAENERLRVSMLWYYTRDILKETDFLHGLQEKASLAQETTGWEFVVIGILDVNFYIRLATIGLPIAVLPRGETLCAHTITRPPGSVFLLPDMMEDWRFRSSPYVELGGLRAYAGAPLRLQNESGDCVGLGSICVCSSTPQAPLTKQQQNTLVRLADWVVSDIIHCARARRQRDRRRMADLLASVQQDIDSTVSEAPVIDVVKAIFPDATISLQSLKTGRIEIEGHDHLSPSDLEDGLWEDVSFIDDFIRETNHKDFPTDRVVRIITAPCESISGPALLVIASKDFRLVFDDVDSWFIQGCAALISQMWQKRLLSEAMRAKERFLRGFSHQLRTPLHGILSSAELLAEELTRSDVRDGAMSATRLLEAASTISDVTTSTYLDIIKTAGRDLIAIINNMITLNRWADIAAADRNHDIHSIYELESQIANELRLVTTGNARPKASIIFTYDKPSDCSTLRIDLGLLRDSLLPLIINALQNTESGLILVALSLDPKSSELIIDVKDTGCGISPEDHERIFEPYEKIDPHSMGVGLGLTLASKFAALISGSVTLVSSDLGCGSHFRVTFKEIDYVNSSTPPLQSSTTLADLPRNFHHIASQTDSTTICEHFVKHLTDHGFASSASTDGCFFIFDYAVEPDRRCDILKKLPAGQVAICLVPASIEEGEIEQVSNVVFTHGPFYYSTLTSALEAANKLASIGLENRQSLEPHLEERQPASTETKELSTTTENVILAVEATEPVAESLTAEVKSIESSTSGPVKIQTTVVCLDVPETQTQPTLVLPILLKCPNTPRPTALLVDDNAINLRILQVYCKKRGFPCHSAVDGNQAVEIFTRHQSQASAGTVSPIQLILMDLQMPACDGIEATQRIRALETKNNWQRSVLFIVTGQDGPTDRVEAQEAGADDYFVKPVGIKLLDSSVKRYFPAFEGA